MNNQTSTIGESPATATAWCQDAIAMRYAISIAAGLATTLLLFFLMQALIKSDTNPFTDPGKGQVVEFARLQEEVEIPESRPRPKPPPPPDEIPPDRPRPEFIPDGEHGIELIPPPKRRGIRGLVGPVFKADGEYLPIVKVEPVYPRRAQQRGIEGYVLLEFTVTTSGAVRDPVVVEAKPPGIFDRSAIQAALKFKYRPKVANGEPMEVSGVRNLIKFEIEEG